MIGAPPQAATEVYAADLDRIRRLVGLRVQTLALAVVDPDDAVGWARLTALGTDATVVAQQAAKDATAAYAMATLEAAGAPLDPVNVPIQPGYLGSGRDVQGLFSSTSRVVQGRTAAGATFPEALAASAQYLVGVASSEPHRIGRDGLLATGLSDSRFERYRRVAVGATCEFCLMLATRGAVYLSAESAGVSRKYHVRCDCRIELVVGADAITRSTELQGDWRNASRDEQRLIDAGAMDGRVDPVVAPAPFRHDANTVQRLKNADLESEMKAAWDAEDWDAADLLEAEMDRRQKWATGWGRSFDEYDDWRPLDDLADAADLPDLDDLPNPPRMSRRAVRSEWEANQEIRMYDAELEGGGIHPQLRAEAQSKGITLATLMNGDPRTAYKYANQELLGWWQRNGRNPLYELEAKHGRLDSTALAKARMTEGRARERAERLLGKDRREGVAQLDAERRAANRRRGV